MQLADPEGFKASEEAVSGTNGDMTELPFLNILRHLREFRYFCSRLCITMINMRAYCIWKILVISLWRKRVQSADPIKLEHLYNHAIDTLVQIHLGGAFSGTPIVSGIRTSL